jgi:hypothetical protein
MKTLKQLMSAAILSILASTAVAQTTSPNLVPLPNHWTTNGQSVVQSYAINQALALSGSDVRINGFDYGYQYNLGNSWTQCTAHNQDGSCSWTMTFNPRVDVNVSIRDNNNAQIYGITHTETGVNTGNRSRDFQYRFTDPRDILTLGNFNFTSSTSPNATVFGMYSRAVYTTVDPCVSNPQSSPACPGYKTYYQMWDDGFARVDLPFAFPFYGNLYTTSYMYTNGVVGFLNNNWGFCCDGTNLNGQAGTPNSPWNYAIYALNTDLIPGPSSEFYTQVTDGGTGLKYSWVNVPEIGTNLNNTFHVQIKDSGYIGITYDQVNLNPWRNPLIGIAGDISQGQYSQTYFGPASGLPSLAGVTNVYTGTETTDICSINPLHSPSCPGYQQAYFNQQCSANPLYDPTCTGYAQAYFTQQCSINTLYDPQCPGYATAYYNYQCSANSLYHTGCPGYASAYFDQQCSLDPLYNSQCPGYDTAYFDQQCSLNPLYNNQCSGYADAYYVQQCTADPLYDSGCTGYETAFFNQQCSNDALYNNQCPGYGEAYAKKNILNIGNTVATPTTETAVMIVAEEVKVETVSASTPSETKVVADPVVNSVVTATSTSANASANPAAAVQLTAPASAPAATTAAAKTEEKKEEKKTETTASASTTTTSSASSSSSSGGQKTTRQALAERRLEAARAAAVERGKNAGSEVAGATSMEQQVELQNVVVAAMGFTPGFDAYGKVNLQDAIGYKPFVIYPGQRNIDTPAGRRLLTGADRLHQEMVDQQYAR